MPSYSQFCPKFRCHGNGGRSGEKRNWQHSMAHPRKPPYRRKNLAKNLLRMPSYSQFCPKFRCHGNGGRSGEKRNWQHSMAHPRKPPYRCKNLAKISYASQVIANFVPNFVAMATGVSGGKTQLAAFDGPSLKTPYRRKNLLRNPSYSPFCPKFCCHGNQGGSGVKLNDTVRFAIPENHTPEPKFTTLSYIQPKL